VLLFNHWTAFNAAVYAAARRLRVPYVACPCGALPIRGRSRALKHAYELTVGRRLRRDAAICVATTARERAELLNGRSAPRRIAVIPNAVAAPASSATLGEDAATTAFRRGLAVGGAPIVLFMGRLDPIKGPDLLIESFARVAPRFPQHVLVLAGPDGGMGPALASLAAARGIGGRVRFAGWIDHHRTRAAYLAAAFLVVPSRSEAMSLVALEAGAVGTPVLITSPCGFDVDGEVGGGLVVEATIEGLATGLQHLIDRADELPRMGARLREHVAAHYVWPVVGRQWFDVCAEAAATSKLG
jgi:glycosyltransferase involved in cell wall biosynthesis